jgi:hypothetical protein
MPAALNACPNAFVDLSGAPLGRLFELLAKQASTTNVD